MHWTAWHFVCIVNCLSCVLIKATGKEREKQSVNKASQFFFLLVLALLVSLASETQPMPAWITFSV